MQVFGREELQRHPIAMCGKAISGLKGRFVSAAEMLLLDGERIAESAQIRFISGLSAATHSEKMRT